MAEQYTNYGMLIVIAIGISSLLLLHSIGVFSFDMKSVSGNAVATEAHLPPEFVLHGNPIDETYPLDTQLKIVNPKPSRNTALDFQTYLNVYHADETKAYSLDFYIISQKGKLAYVEHKQTTVDASNTLNHRIKLTGMSIGTYTLYAHFHHETASTFDYKTFTIIP